MLDFSSSKVTIDKGEIMIQFDGEDPVVVGHFDTSAGSSCFTFNPAFGGSVVFTSPSGRSMKLFGRKVEV